MKRLVLWLIKAYQKSLSWDHGWAQKVLPGLKVCRFTPTCSQYTYQAIDKYGVLKGGWRGLRRILRCHPFSRGGYDPLR